jgi:hypothetical protein
MKKSTIIILLIMSGLALAQQPPAHEEVVATARQALTLQNSVPIKAFASQWLFLTDCGAAGACESRRMAGLPLLLLAATMPDGDWVDGWLREHYTTAELAAGVVVMDKVMEEAAVPVNEETKLRDELTIRYQQENRREEILEQARAATNDHDLGMNEWLLAGLSTGQEAHGRIAKAAILLNSDIPIWIYGTETTDLMLNPERKLEALPLILLAESLGTWAGEELAGYTPREIASVDLAAFKKAALDLQP